MLFGGSISPSSIQLLCSRQSSPLFSVAEDGPGEKKTKKLREKVQMCVSLSPSSAPAGFYAEFERKLEKRLPRTHSSALPFHPLTYFHSHIFYSGCLLGVTCTHKHKCMQMRTRRRYRQISRPCQNHWYKEGRMC